MDTNENTNATVVLNNDEYAKQQADLLGNGVAATIEAVADADETSKNGPLTLMIALAKAIGPDEFAAWPVPGTKQEDVKGTNARHDISEGRVDGKKVEHSFYKVAFDRSPYGIKCSAEIKKCQDGKSDPQTEYGAANMPSEEREALLKRWEARQRAGRNLLAKAKNLFDKIEAIRALPGVKCRAIMTGKGDNAKLASVLNPIFIGSSVEGEETNFSEYSIGQVLKLDVDKAKATVEETPTVGMWSALDKTLDRSKKGKKAAKFGIADGKLTGITKDSFDVVCLGLASKLRRQGANDKEFTTFLADLDTDEGQSNLAALIDLSQAVDRVLLLKEAAVNKYKRQIDGAQQAA